MPSEMRRLKELEDENARLKRIVADLSLCSLSATMRQIGYIAKGGFVAHHFPGLINKQALRDDAGIAEENTEYAFGRTSKPGNSRKDRFAISYVERLKQPIVLTDLLRQRIQSRCIHIISADKPTGFN